MRGGGMNHKIRRIVFIVFVIGFLLLSPVLTIAENDATVNMHVIEEKTQTRFNNPVIIAGIWHHINVTLDTQDFQELILKFYKGSSMPSEEERDETNYYEWKYDKNSATPWIDTKKYGGREYINISRSTKNSSDYSFCVGIKDTLPETNFYHENWTLEAYKDGDKLYSGDVAVEKPTSSLAKPHGDIIIFNVDPFTVMDASGHDYFRIENKGNLPMDITVSYGAYNDMLEYNNFCTKLSPDSSCRFDGITIHTESRQPGITEIEGTVSGKVPDSIKITVTNFTFGISVGIAAPIFKIVAAHANYELKTLPGNITFQYEKSLEMSEDEIKDITAYISGNGVVTLDLRSENLTIIKVLSGGAEVDTPTTIISTNTSEHVVTISVKALREDSNAFLYYDLKIGDETQTFYTQINVGPPVSSTDETTIEISHIMILLVIIVIVIVYIIYTQRKYRRR